MSPIVYVAGLLLVGHQSPIVEGASSEVVLTPTSAYALMEPQALCAPSVIDAKWSPTGHSILVRRMDGGMPGPLAALISTLGAPPTHSDVAQEIFVWNVETGKLNTVRHYMTSEGSFGGWQWIRGSDTALVAMSDDKVPSRASGSGGFVTNVYAVFGTSGRTTSILHDETTPIVRMAPSPNRPLVAVSFVNPRNDSSWVYFVVADGKPGPRIDLPSARCEVDWSAEGQAYVAVREATVVGGKRKVAVKWHRIDRAGGYIERQSSEFKAAEAPEVQEAEIVGRGVGIPLSIGRLRGTANTISLDARDDEGPAIVTTDGTGAQINPPGTAVFYVSQQAAFVRKILKAPRSEYEKAHAIAQRQAVMNNAKQAALALLMYSGDSDDVFPSSKGDWRSQLMPYLKDSNILNEFTYTFAGGPASDIEQPAHTEFGFISGPGGRAVAYADGHVVWIPDGS